jgi:hypothetical protein
MFHIKPKEQQPNPKEVFPHSEEIIQYDFSIDDRDFFSFEDFNTIPGDRGFHCLSFYNELSQRCTRDYLIAFSTALDNIMNNNKNGIQITELIKLNLQMKERLEWLIEPEIAYKLCSVVYFDETENPYTYNYLHSGKNADLFKKCPLDSFFLSTPIVKLIPYISGFSSDFTEYCQMVNLMNKDHLKDISQMLSENDKRREFYNSIKLLLEQESL